MATRTSNKEAAKTLETIRDLLGFSHITPEHAALRKENEALRETNDALRIEAARTEEGKGYAELKLLYDPLVENYDVLSSAYDAVLGEFNAYKREVLDIAEPEG